MKTEKIKNGIIAGLVLIIITLFVFNCSGKSSKTDDNPALTQDTIFLSQWRKERKEKQALVQTYEKKVTELQQKNKTLQQSAQQSKQQLYSYRKKADSVQVQLQTAIHYFAKKDSSINDTITPLIHELSSIRDSSDRQCDTTIALLEKGILNRDSILVLQKQIETQLRDFNEEQTLQNSYLTNQINIAYKQQKKKSRQVKLLSGGILILSGITTSILLIHSQR